MLLFSCQELTDRAEPPKAGAARPAAHAAHAGMLLGALSIGLHMAMTHGVSLGMLSSYIPNDPLPHVGRVGGTAWSFTDLVFGEPGSLITPLYRRILHSS